MKTTLEQALAQSEKHGEKNPLSSTGLSPLLTKFKHLKDENNPRRLKISLSVLADKTHICESSLQKFSSGKRAPSNEQAVSIAKTLSALTSEEITPDDLFNSPERINKGIALLGTEDTLNMIKSNVTYVKEQVLKSFSQMDSIQAYRVVELFDVIQKLDYYMCLFAFIVSIFSDQDRKKIVDYAYTTNTSIMKQIKISKNIDVLKRIQIDSQKYIDETIQKRLSKNRKNNENQKEQLYHSLSQKLDKYFETNELSSFEDIEQFRDKMGFACNYINNDVWDIIITYAMLNSAEPQQVQLFNHALDICESGDYINRLTGSNNIITQGDKKVVSESQNCL